MLNLFQHPFATVTGLGYAFDPLRTFAASSNISAMKAAGIIIAIAVLGLFSSCGQAEPRSSLVANLHGLPVEQAAAELDRRLRDRFGPGTNENKLIGALKAEGFQLAQRNDFLCDAPKCASLEWWPDRLGGVAWSVHWDIDRNGRVTSLRAGVALLN